MIGAFIIEPLANLTSTSLRGADAGAIRLLLFGGLLGAVVLFLIARREHEEPDQLSAADLGEPPQPRKLSCIRRVKDARS